MHKCLSETPEQESFARNVRFTHNLLKQLKDYPLKQRKILNKCPNILGRKYIFWFLREVIVGPHLFTVNNKDN